MYNSFKDLLEHSKKLNLTKNKPEIEEFDIEEDAVPVFYDVLSDLNDKIRNLSSKMQKDMKSVGEMNKLLATIN